MRRIKLILVLGVVMAAMLVAVQGPAVAQDIDFDGIDDGVFFCDDFDGFCDFDDGAFFFDGTVPVSQSFDQEAESGDFSASFETFNAGDNSNVTAPALQFGNTGNLQNAQGVIQFDSTADDIEFEGGSLEFAPSLETDSSQTVQQSATSSRR